MATSTGSNVSGMISSALGQWRIRPRRRAGIFGEGTDRSIVRPLFDNMRCPARDPGKYEQRRKQGGRDSCPMKSDRTIEIEIREQAFFPPHDRLDAFGDGVKPPISRRFGELPGPALDDRRAGIADLINPVAEAHDLFLVGKPLQDP